MSHRPFEIHGHGVLAAILPHGKPCPAEARPFVLAATILASSLAFVDATIVGIAVPAMQIEFQSVLAELQWVVNAYALLLGALILVGGGLGDRIGRRLIFIWGIGIFTVASVACALAPTVGMLIAARAIQGVGAALLVPQSLALITANFPKDIRGKAIGTWAAASAITTSLGPPIGGFLIDTLSWRAAFWINLPLAAIALWLTYTYMEESRDESATGPVDWAGAAVATAAFGALTYGLTILSDEGAGTAAIASWIGAGAIGIVAFVLIEARARNPIMPLDLFSSRIFSGVNIATFFVYGALAGALFLVPFDLLARRGISAFEAGLVMLPFGLIIGIASRYTGDLADKYGPRPFLTGGPIIVAVGCLGFTLSGLDVWIGPFGSIIVMSVGMAILVSPLTTAVMNAAPDNRSGAASGISNTASRLSGVLAIAIFGATASLVFSLSAPTDAVFGLIPAPGDPARRAVEGAFLAGYNAALIFAGVWCLVAAAVSFVSLEGTGPAKPESGGPASETPSEGA